MKELTTKAKLARIKENKRTRERNRRLNYSKTRLISKEYRKHAKRKYLDKYPEKLEAHNASRHIESPAGKQKHHWSYNQEHKTDVIFISKALHNKLHTYLIYDSKFKMYRTIGGVLLDTRIKHNCYLMMISDINHEQILKLFM